MNKRERGGGRGIAQCAASQWTAWTRAGALLAFFVQLGGAALHAQGLEGPSIQREEIPYAFASGACGGGTDARVASVQDAVRVAFPLARSGDVVVGNSLGWNHLQLRYEGFDSCFQPHVSDLWALSYSVFVRVAEEDGGAWLYTAGLQRSGEGYPTNPDDTRYSGGALRTSKTSADTTWGLGAFYTYVLGAPRIVPGFTYLYLREPWQVSVRLPFNTDIWYRTSELVRIGAQLRFSGGAFSLDRTDPKATELRYANGTAGMALALGAAHGLQGEVSLGYTFYRVYQIVNGAQDVETLNLRNERYARAGVSYRF